MQTVERARRPIYTISAVQLALALLLSIGTPILFYTVFGGLDGRPFVFDQPAFNASIATVIAVVLTHYAVNRFTAFPGVSTGSYMVVSVVGGFGLAAIGLLVARVGYSLVIFLGAFIIAGIFYTAVYFVVRRRRRPKIALLPNSGLEEALKGTHVRVTKLLRPQDYDPDMGPPVLDLRRDQPDEWLTFITDCTLRGIPVYHTRQISEQIFGKVPVEHLSENQFGSLLPNMLYIQVKVILDFVLALVLLPVALLIIAVLAPFMWASQGAGIFFRQKRMGYRGQVFHVLKLRSMEASETGDPESWEAAHTESNDPRITPIGRFLRRHRLDEIPQILNVLRGQMSFIGPRPEARVLVERYERELPFYRYRHIVRPGITGWAQVNQGHVTSKAAVLQKLHYDFFYIKYMSAWLDFLIVLRTLRVLILGHGAR